MKKKKKNINLEAEISDFIAFYKLVMNKADGCYYCFVEQKGIYKPVDDVELDHLIDEYINSGYSDLDWASSSFSSLRNLITAKVQYIDDMDSDYTRIPFKNGIYNIKKRKLFKHSPKHHFTTCLPYEYNPEATCERMDKFMEEISEGDEDWIESMWAFMGLVALSNTKAAKFFILYGTGSNGKSLLQRTLIHSCVLPSSVTSLTLNDINNPHSFLLHKLSTSRLNVMDELPSDITLSRLFESRVKSIVGADTDVLITADVKYAKEPLQFTPHLNMCANTNILPKVDQKLDYAILRRYLVFPFNRQFTEKEQDKELGVKLQAEAAGIFNKAVAAAERLIANDYQFPYQKKSNEFIFQSVPKKYPYESFVGNCLEFAEGNEVMNKELTTAFTRWLHKNGITLQDSERSKAIKLSKAIRNCYPEVQSITKHEKAGAKLGIRIKE